MARSIKKIIISILFFLVLEKGASQDTSFTYNNVKINKGLALAFLVIGGPIGLHRVYLGTSPQIPLIYGMTIGGGGLLLIWDAYKIIFSKNLYNLRNRTTVLMR